jgi:Matrixin
MPETTNPGCASRWRASAVAAGRRTGRAQTRTVLAAALITFSFAPDAPAFCQATTCDVSQTPCPRDARGCALVGHPLTWKTGCVEMRVEGGSLLRAVSLEDVSHATNNALATWSQAQCGRASTPAIAYGVVSGAAELRSEVSGAVRFLDRDWPHHDLHSNVALTTLTVDRTTGHILQANVELNSFAQPFFNDGALTRYDLELVLLHEMGHVLGLSHSGHDAARMSAEYSVPEHRQRWLSEDDERGVCAAYPPTRAPSCLATVGPLSLCETLEECRWVALGLLSLCWAVFGLLWRYRHGLCRADARNGLRSNGDPAIGVVR